mmetsp:Transcript_4787/g.14028  ORF Transcript_4787/g.14028 Transcript_4787/m.14028 type:complete len:512 (-) Transcript_4787:338-1873(-)
MEELVDQLLVLRILGLLVLLVGALLAVEVPEVAHLVVTAAAHDAAAGAAAADGLVVPVLLVNAGEAAGHGDRGHGLQLVLARLLLLPQRQDALDLLLDLVLDGLQLDDEAGLLLSLPELELPHLQPELLHLRLHVVVGLLGLCELVGHARVLLGPVLVLLLDDLRANLCQLGLEILHLVLVNPGFLLDAAPQDVSLRRCRLQLQVLLLRLLLQQLGLLLPHLLDLPDALLGGIHDDLLLFLARLDLGLDALDLHLELGLHALHDVLDVVALLLRHNLRLARRLELLHHHLRRGALARLRAALELLDLLLELQRLLVLLGLARLGGLERGLQLLHLLLVLPLQVRDDVLQLGLLGGQRQGAPLGEVLVAQRLQLLEAAAALAADAGALAPRAEPGAGGAVSAAAVVHPALVLGDAAGAASVVGAAAVAGAGAGAGAVRPPSPGARGDRRRGSLVRSGAASGCLVHRLLHGVRPNVRPRGAVGPHQRPISAAAASAVGRTACATAPRRVVVPL